ncbi:MAG: hypothetical protein Q8R36_01900 [bacterium]|nr:hypothetical protein [bacterium]
MGGKEDNSQVLDVNGAREIFKKANLSGIVSLIDFLTEQLEKGNVIKKLGMCLDPFGVTEREFSPEAASLLKQVDIGSRDGKMLPLDHLALLARDIEKINPEALKLVDKAWGEIVRVLRGFEAGDYEEIIDFDDDDNEEAQWENEGGSIGQQRRLH